MHNPSMARVGGTRVYSTDCTVVTLYSIKYINAICELHNDTTHYTGPSL